MSSGVISLQRPYISFNSPLLRILRWEITAAAVALLSPAKHPTKILVCSFVGYLLFRDFCENVCDEPVPQLKFYEEVSKH